jgi:predicted DNA binding protein
MKRRAFFLGVAGVSAGGLAGCVAHPEVVLTLNEVSDGELADRASNNAGIIERDIEEPNVTSELFENGTYRRTGRWEEVNTDLRYVYEGEYYRLDAETSPAPPDVVHIVEAEYVGDEKVEGETEYDELPEVDREALSFLTSAELTEGSYESSVEHLYEAGADEESAIVSGTTVVVVDGRRFSVETEESQVLDRQEFDYTAEKIASSQDEFVSWLKEEYMFELSGLSDEERAIVEKAIEEGYYENSSEEAFESLVNRFQEHDAVEPEEEGGYWIVEYEGTTYWTDLRY